jgi:hypothetical protein
MVAKFRKPILLLVSFLLALNTYAGTIDPQFKDYTVDNIFTGPNYPLDASDLSDNKLAIYRSNAIKRKVNFAGHYIIYTVNCGGGAICGEILDAKTGKIVSGFPNAYQLDSSDGSYYDAGFRSDSRLLGRVNANWLQVTSCAILRAWKLLPNSSRPLSIASRDSGARSRLCPWIALASRCIPMALALEKKRPSSYWKIPRRLEHQDSFGCRE